MWVISLHIFLLLAFFVASIVSFDLSDFELPIFPSRPPKYDFNSTVSWNGKKIPRILWIALKDINDGLNYQLPPLFERNSEWSVQICDNTCKDKFIDESFANTSFRWAYHILSSEAGAAKADIWRYAVLWSFGGAYIDDDSDIRTPLDQVVEPNDTLIVSYEKNGFNADGCYIPRFHLSDAFTYLKNETRRSLDIFHGRILLNWAIMSSPHHPVISRAMMNIVEIIRSEYFREPLLRHLRTNFRWQLIMCATGPSLLTGSAREMVLFQVELWDIYQHLVVRGRSRAELSPDQLQKLEFMERKHNYNITDDLLSLDFTYRLAGLDFQGYGGKFKAVYMRVVDNPTHYMNVLQRKKNVHLLSSYQNETELSAILLRSWEGEVVQAQNGKQIFLMKHGARHGFQNFETFIAMNFTMSDVRVISDDRLNSIPLGNPLPYMIVPSWH